MIIYRIINGVKTVLHDLEVDNQTELRQSISGEDLITSRFIIEGAKLDIQIGDFVEFKDSVYTILEEPTVKKTQNTFNYNLQFKSDQYILKNVQVMLDDESEFFLFGNAIDAVSLIITNLNRVYDDGLYYADYIEETESKNIAFNSENGLAALQRLASEFECEFTVKGKKITFRKKIGEERNITLEYKKGLREIERQTLQSAELVTVLYAYGSERNITNEYGSKRLKIPKLENNKEVFGTIERSVTFEDVYPRFKGSVGTVNGNYFTDTAINFNLNDQLIGGAKAKVVFNTGDLAGREFEIATFNNTTKKVELIPFTDETDLRLPNDVLKPRVGDKYVFINIKMPAEYITAAEEELLERATEYLEKYSQPNVIYKVTPHYPDLTTFDYDFNLGDVITLKDLDFNIEFKTRVLSLNQKINRPKEYALDIGNQVTVNYLTQVLNDQKEIRNNIYQNNKYLTERFNRVFNNIQGFSAPLYVNMGLHNATTYYYNNLNRRDYVYLLDQNGRKVWYYFIGADHTRGEFIAANWQFIGDNFDIIATQTLLAENANIGNWLIQNGQIVSQSFYDSTDESEIEPTAQLNGTHGFLKFVSPIYVNVNGQLVIKKQTLTINQVSGLITSEVDGVVSAFGSTGIAANKFGGQTVTDPDGVKGTAAVIGNGVGSLPANVALGGPQYAAGVIGIGKNNYLGAKAPTYGGAFWGLKSSGRYVGVKRIETYENLTSYTVQEFDELITCYNGKNIIINLPANPLLGRKIEIKRFYKDVKVKTLDNSKLYRHKEINNVDINPGDAWVFIWDGKFWTANWKVV